MRLRTLRHDVIWGAGWRLLLGVVYCVFALLVMLKGFPDGPVLALLGIYLGGGLLEGLLRHWMQTEVRTMMVGVIVMVPIGAGFLYLMNGPISSWGEAQVFALFAGSLLLGPMGGKIFCEQSRFDPNG